jgi:hypothetical protein
MKEPVMLVALAVAAATLGNPAAPPAVWTPVAPVQSSPPVTCQFDVYHGRVFVGLPLGDHRILPVRVVIRNNADTRAVLLTGYTNQGEWSHGVYRTYTDRNVASAYVGTHRCEPT